VLATTSPPGSPRRWPQRALAGVLLGLLSIDALPLPVQGHTCARCGPASQLPPQEAAAHSHAQSGGRGALWRHPSLASSAQPLMPALLTSDPGGRVWEGVQDGTHRGTADMERQHAESGDRVTGGRGTRAYQCPGGRSGDGDPGHDQGGTPAGRAGDPPPHWHVARAGEAGARRPEPQDGCRSGHSSPASRAFCGAPDAEADGGRGRPPRGLSPPASTLPEPGAQRRRCGSHPCDHTGCQRRLPIMQKARTRVQSKVQDSPLLDEAQFICTRQPADPHVHEAFRQGRPPLQLATSLPRTLPDTAKCGLRPRLSACPSCPPCSPHDGCAVTGHRLQAPRSVYKPRNAEGNFAGRVPCAVATSRRYTHLRCALSQPLVRVA
jgi:hypothetical protein